MSESVAPTATGDDVETTRLWETAKAAWPGVDVPREDFARYLSARTTEGAAAAITERAADLYLACGCGMGLSAALASFESRIMSQVPAAINRVSSDDSFITEVLQLVREKLFVGRPEIAPKIGEYSGQGALLGWVRAVAVRAAISLTRQRRDKSLEEMGGDQQILDGAEDPELAYLKTRYRVEFQEACAAALAQLPTEQRNLLRLHLIDGLNIDKIAVMFQIHRATAARWLHSAREAVFTETRRLLQERLRVSPAEFESLVRLVQSQLHLSVARLLEEATDNATKKPAEEH